MSTKTRAAIAALLTAAMAALAAACGSDDSNRSADPARPAGNPTDRAFIAAMVPHHQSAVAMAEVAQREGESRFVKGLADDIISSQNREIARMRRIDDQLAGVGVKRGELGMDSAMMGMDMSPDMLEGADPFDARFIELMVPHHEGAIEMAKVELAKGRNAELKTLAQAIIRAQQREVRQMRGQRETASSAGHGVDAIG